jgi:hypothetical protein
LPAYSSTTAYPSSPSEHHSHPAAASSGNTTRSSGRTPTEFGSPPVTPLRRRMLRGLRRVSSPRAEGPSRRHKSRCLLVRTKGSLIGGSRDSRFPGRRASRQRHWSVLQCAARATLRPAAFAISWLAPGPRRARVPRVAGNTGGAARCSCSKESRGQRLPARSNGRCRITPEGAVS